MKLKNTALVFSLIAGVTSLALPTDPLRIIIDEDPPIRIELDVEDAAPAVVVDSNQNRNRYIVKLRDDPSAQGASIAKQYMQQHAAFINSYAETKRFANIAAGATEQDDSLPRIYTEFGLSFAGYGAVLDADTLSTLKSRPEIAYIEPDQEMRITDTQPNVGSWGIDRIDSRTGLDGSYNYPSNVGAGVTAYILDTGINPSHSDFDNNRATMGPSFISQNEAPGDQNGHGTHVAGTIGGKFSGVAKKCTLVGVKVLSGSGSGLTSGIVNGIDWVIQQAKAGNQRAVINMSLGGGFSRSLNDATTRAVEAGVTVVVAAGNSNADSCNNSPAGAPNVISVGATQKSDTKASYSNWGKCVHILAPGSNIVSSDFKNTQGFKTMSGTSMASPHVAGVAVAMLSRRSYTPGELKTAMASAGTKNVISGFANGTPNILLYLGQDGGGNPPPPPPPPPSDPTCPAPSPPSPPPPPPPPADPGC